MKFDIVIVGASLGGVAAALGACEQGAKVALVGEESIVGGQWTSQAVPPDEHPWIESHGCTRLYRKVRSLVREHYRQFYPLTWKARQNPHFNPGNAFVSQISHEPMVGLKVLESLLQPWCSSGRLTLFLQHQLLQTETDKDQIHSLRTLCSRTQKEHHFEGDIFIDATELGDLIKQSGCEYVVGEQAQSETGELHAPSEANPHNVQAISWCFVLDHLEGQDHTIDKPHNYDFWSKYIPEMQPSWGDKMLSWTATHPITLEPVTRTFSPIRPKPERGPMDLWTFRRIAAKENFQEGWLQSDITLVNWPQIDYLLGSIIDVSKEEKEKHLLGAREQSLSLLYWMQTEAPREDGKTGWPGLRLRPDITGTADGLALAPYIRESRRIQSLFTVCEQHVGVKARKKLFGDNDPRSHHAEHFKDSVGVGAYRIDLHPSTAQKNYIDVSSYPFQIPLKSLIPKRMGNLIAGCKNIGTTHLTNGCYRLHPVEWNIGESAGRLAQWTIQEQKTTHQVATSQELTQDFQSLLIKAGVELEWPRHQAL